MNDESHHIRSTDSQIKLTLMLRSSLRDYCDAYILMSGTLIVTESAADGGNNNIQVVSKNVAPFTNCIREIINTQTDIAIDIDVVMPMYNLIEYCNNYSKTSKRLWQFYRDKPSLTDSGAVVNFLGDSALFKLKQKIAGWTGDGFTKNVEIMVPLKYLSNFWKALEMHLLIMKLTSF